MHSKKDYDPNFNIREVESRIAKSSFVIDLGPKTWVETSANGKPIENDLLQIALADLPVTDENVQQLHLSLCRFWAELGGLETNFRSRDRLSLSLRLLRICCIKYCNIKQLPGGLSYPADFPAEAQLLF